MRFIYTLIIAFISFGSVYGQNCLDLDLDAVLLEYKNATSKKYTTSLDFKIPDIKDLDCINLKYQRKTLD
jgi:hypothetical protein